MLDKVKAALDAIQAKGDFATEVACGSGGLHIEVEAVGPVGFPNLRAHRAKALLRRPGRTRKVLKTSWS